MSSIVDLILRESDGPANARTHPRWAHVTSYNEDTHAVKLRVQPEGTETGWVPLGAIAVGNGFGINAGAKAGDLVLLAYVDGDHDTPTIIGRFFNDKAKPPKVKGGEFAIWHESGTRHVFAKDGSHTATHARGGTMKWDANGAHGTDLKGQPKTLLAGAVTETVPRKVVTGTVHLAAGALA